MKENAATPTSIAAMPASLSLRMPRMAEISARRRGQFAGQAHGALDKGAFDES